MGMGRHEATRSRALCTPNPDTGESPRMCCTCCCCPREPSRRPTSHRLHRRNPGAIPHCCWRSRNSGRHLGLWRWHAPAERTRGVGGPSHLFPSKCLGSLAQPLAGSPPATSPPPQLQVLFAVESRKKERASETLTQCVKEVLRVKATMKKPRGKRVTHVQPQSPRAKENCVVLRVRPLQTRTQAMVDLRPSLGVRSTAYPGSNFRRAAAAFGQA